MKWLFSFLFALLPAEDSFAGLREIMSRAAYSSLPGGESCESVSEKEKMSAVRTLERCAAPIVPSAAHFLAQDAKSIHRSLENPSKDTRAEDRFFALLARENQKELVCAQKFANDLIKTPEAVQLIAERLIALRAAKQKVVTLANQMSNPREYSGVAHCPSQPEELKPNENIVRSAGRDPHYEICEQLLRARAAVKIIEDSIPLRGSSEVFNLTDEYSTAKKVPEDLNARIREAYAAAEKKARQDEETISRILKKDGGSGFARPERRALMSDSLLVDNVVRRAPDAKAMRAVACRANASYGLGADKLDTSLFVAGLLFGSATTVVGRVTLNSARVAAGLNEARFLGLLSYNSAQSIQTAALFTLGTATAANNSLKAYDMIDRACFNSSRLKLKQEGGFCVGTPRVEDLPTENCVVSASLAVLSVALPGTLTSMAVNRIGNEKAISILDKGMPFITRFKDTRKKISITGEALVTTSVTTITWSNTRYGGRSPWDYQRDLNARASKINDLYQKRKRLLAERTSLRATAAGSLSSRLNAIEAELAELNESMKKVRQEYDELAPPQIATFLGEEQDANEITKSLMDSREIRFSPTNDPGVLKGVFSHRTKKGRYRYAALLCDKEEGCARGPDLIKKGGILTVQPECGPDVFKVNMNGSEILQKIAENNLSVDNISYFVPCLRN